VCGEVELNRNGFVVGIPYAADHVACIVAVMRCTKGASVNKTASKRGWRFFPGNALDSEADRCDSSFEASKQERCAVNCHRAKLWRYETGCRSWWVVIVVAVQVLLSSVIVVRV